MADRKQTETQILDWLGQQRPAMTDLLERLVNIDSGSYNKAGVDAVADQQFAAGKQIIAAARLRRKQMITTEHSLGGDLNYDARVGWFGAYANPTTVGNMMLKLILHGPISRPATR